MPQMEKLYDIRDAIKNFRKVEIGIWKTFNQFPINYDSLFSMHKRLQEHIDELYSEIVSIENIEETKTLFERLNSEKGKIVLELLESLKNKLAEQSSALVELDKKVKAINEPSPHGYQITEINRILNGYKPDYIHESENSRQIQQIEATLIELLSGL